MKGNFYFFGPSVFPYNLIEHLLKKKDPSILLKWKLVEIVETTSRKHEKRVPLLQFIIHNSPFYLPCKKLFSPGFKYFFMLAVIFCILKNQHPMQKMMHVVIDFYNFDQEFLIIGIFWKILSKYSIQFWSNLHKMQFCSICKKQTLPVEIKRHPDKTFLHHAKIQFPCFAVQIKRTLLLFSDISDSLRMSQFFYLPPGSGLLDSKDPIHTNITVYISPIQPARQSIVHE